MAVAKPKAKAAAPKPASKSDIVKGLCESSGLTKKDVIAVLDGLCDQATNALADGGPGIFKIHGLVQLKKVHKPAQPARRGMNPFTKQEQDYPAKPASNKVKANALKQLRDAVQ